MKHLHLYQLALDADKAYSTAITAQFGCSATRWDHNPVEYNELTQTAWRLKKLADAAWGEAQK